MTEEIIVSDAKENLKDSLNKIVSYSDVQEEVGKKFISDINKFVELLNNKNKEDEIRVVKKSIDKNFFIIYENVIKRVIKENNNDRLYNMFLNYGYVDERLFTDTQLNQLYNINDNQTENLMCNIYTPREWLEAIYLGDKESSVDDFDTNYLDMVKKLKKTNHLSEKEVIEYQNDKDKKLNYEISNMFKINQRLCCNQASLYCSVLYNDMIVGDIDRAFISKSIINENLKKLLDIDFSAFHREAFCHEPERGLEKQYIMKQIMPDIILMPTFGFKGVMWQDISDRDKTKPARFTFPIFCGNNIYDLLVNVVGMFRWELCKTEMGANWSDITVKSLTSEYSDYIQFYKKNNDLSVEAKQKLKLQISRYRNMLRNIFAADYEIWIKYESQGAVRLNTAVREILYSYCPFSKSIRDNLEKQIQFSKAALKYNKTKTKKIKEIENKITKLSKTKTGVPKELEEELDFYKNK